MIHPDALKEFVARKRDSHDWVKNVPAADLDAELKALRVQIVHPTPLMIHQKACFLLGVAYPAFAFWLDLGTGKTRLALELLRYHKQQSELTGALILVRSQSALISWENQIREWKIDLPYVSLPKSMPSEEKWSKLEDFEGGLIITTFGGLTRMLSILKAVKGKRKQKMTPSPKAIKKLAALIQAIVPDEASTLSNKASVISRLVHQLRKYVRFYYELDGMPMGRDPTALWNQLFLVDRGETLGETLGLFRAAFFDEKDNYWGGKDYKFRKAMEPELYRILKHRSITYAEEECADLPKVILKMEEVDLPQEASTYYETFVKQIRARYAGYQERKNAFIRMRQVSSGFVGFTDDETGERAEIAFAENPKLERLLELVDQVPKGRKFVIFHYFTYSGAIISKALKEAGIKHDRLWGGTKDERAVQDRFDYDDSYQGLVASTNVAAYSLNLQRGNYYFVYEAPVSPKDARQMRKRLPRQGQTRTVFGFDLCVRGTVDRRILQFHREGQSLFDAIIRNPEKALAD